MKRLTFLLLAALALGLVAGCGSGSGSRLSGGTGTVNLLLTDAPAEYDHVYLDVREVWIRGSVDTADDTPDTTAALLAGGGDETGWIRLDVTPVIVDLLTLRNGVFLGLASGEVPAGHYDEIRLVLGGQNSIVVDSVSHDLKVPSGSSSGLKLKGAFHVPVGGVVDVGVDFDAARSIVLTGAGQYLLKPVVRVHPVEVTGSISGDVDPDDAASQVFAIVGTDTIATTTTGAEGKFTLAMLLAGSYRVCVAPYSADWADTCLSGVLVTPGNETALGKIVLPASDAAPAEGWTAK